MAAEADWSDLPREILDLIVSKLSLLDLVRCRVVCFSWRNLITDEKIKPQPPWLMLPGDDNLSAKCFNPAENMAYRILFPSPMIRRRICIGSNQGWLITVDDDCDIQLVNPITGVQFQLPSVATLPNVKADRRGKLLKFHLDGKHSKRREYWGSVAFMHGFFFRKAVVALPDPAAASGGRGFTVMLVHQRLKLAYVRAGDKAWTPVTMPNRYDVADIVCHDGKFYTVSSRIEIKIWVENGNNFESRTIHKFPVTGEYSIYVKYLAVTMSGQLMLVLRDRFDTTLEFKVLGYDQKRDVWFDMDDLQDNVVFIGKNNTFCVDASVVPGLKRNCVYYTDDDYEQLTVHRHRKRDMGFFDLTDRQIKQMDSLPSHFNWPPPIWFTPTLC